MITAVIAGPELDAEIAKIVGVRWRDVCADESGDYLKVSARELERCFLKSYPELDDDASFAWSPSEDVEAAMDCAVAVGLFRDLALTCRGPRDWYVVSKNDRVPPPRLPEYNTPSLALCAAILATSEHEKEGA